MTKTALLTPQIEKSVGPDAVTRHFNLNSQPQTMELGAALAPVLKTMLLLSWRDKQEMRMGLSGNPGSGKTALAYGMFSKLAGQILGHIVDRSTDADKPQAEWRIGKGGRVRHCDKRAMSINESYLLSLSCASNLAASGVPSVDVIEHPFEDTPDLSLNVLIHFEGAASEENGPSSLPSDFVSRVFSPEGFDEPRQITVSVSREIAATTGFKKFLDQTRHFG